MYQAPPNLSNIHILLADGDLYMAGILCHMLHTLGFEQVSRVSTGQKAMDLVESGKIDLLITEWSMQGAQGLDLVSLLRDPKRSPNLTMPIIMMTGRAERLNVTQARDAGVTEFLVKPITTAMLFDRIRRVFDAPRDFVIAHNFVGPDRRHRDDPAHAGENRSGIAPLIVSNASTASTTSERPIIIKRSHDLRRKANLVDSISSVITPEMLKKAESVISSYQDDSQQWISEDIKALTQAIELLQADIDGAGARAQNAALNIKSRAGMFGYDMAANVAFSLYVFLFNDFQRRQEGHLLIARKHAEAIKVLLAGRALGNSEQMEEELVGELLKMTAKLKNVNLTPKTAASA